MENNDTPKNQGDSAQDMSTTPAKAKGREQQGKPNDKANKAAKQKKKSLREGWRSSSAIKKTELILLAVGSAVGAAYLIAYLCVSYRQINQTLTQHMPLVINSRAPELLQGFVCDPKKGLMVGMGRSHVKNIGNATAYDVLPYSMPKVVPEQKTGNRIFDSLPRIACDADANPSPVGFPLAPGIETNPETIQGIVSLPSLSEGAKVQLFTGACVSYRDEYGGKHATCDTYRFFFSSSNPTDVGETPTFICDKTPKVGRFVGHITGHCQK
jgi:hypothetical protein